MHEVTRSWVLLNGSAWISRASIRDSVNSRDDLRSRSEGTPSAHCIVALFIIVLALVNVTSMVLMLRSWSENRFLDHDVTEVLLVDTSPKNGIDVEYRF